MQSEAVLVLVIGPSGAGKSTLIASSVRYSRLHNRIRLAILPKESTRPRRSEVDEAEYRHVTRDTFSRAKSADLYIVDYTIFDESYGLRWEDLDRASRDLILIQTVPTNVAVEVQRRLSNTHSVRIVLLDTPPAVARERLLKRADPGTLRSLEARMSTASRSRRHAAEFVIEGGRHAEQELSDFMTWVVNLASDKSTSHGEGEGGIADG